MSEKRNVRIVIDYEDTLECPDGTLWVTGSAILGESGDEVSLGAYIDPETGDVDLEDFQEWSLEEDILEQIGGEDEELIKMIMSEWCNALKDLDMKEVRKAIYQ